MWRIIKALPFVIFLVLAPALLYVGQFKVIRVSDGDTVKAQGHDIEIKVRLVGIDAPETGRKKHDPGQPYSQKSKKYLTSLVLNRTVAKAMALTDMAVCSLLSPWMAKILTLRW
jgi:hypothetical protein